MLHAVIPLSQHSCTGSELQYVRSAIESRRVGGGGAFSRRVETLLRNETGSAAALLTTSCTHALEMSALLLNLEPGDEVIVPAYTFVTTASAFALRGATPVFADATPGTLNVDPAHVERLITPRTRAIVCMHYAGVACDMPKLEAICASHGLPLVEDCAHALFGRHSGKPLGTFGRLATLSFHESKNFACGEGGALLVNDAALTERAEIVREKGTDRSQFLRGEVDKYTWRELGSSYVLSDILAAYLLAQLESQKPILERRQWAYEHYMRELADWASETGVSLPVVPAECEPTWHLFHLLLPRPEHQAEFIRHMHRHGVGCAFHYVPLNTTPYGTRVGGTVGSCPVAEDAAVRLVRLPLHPDLDEDDLQRVVRAARAWNPG